MVLRERTGVMLLGVVGELLGNKSIIFRNFLIYIHRNLFRISKNHIL